MRNLILNCDVSDGLSQLADNSIDLIVTDPPYGLQFMSKDWDKAVPSVDVWKGCLRVLKDGAFAFIMSSPRLDVLSQMIIRLEKAGFNIGFTPIYWAYASGFPKAGNIGKMVDKRNERTQETYIPFAEYLKKCRKKKGLSKSKIDIMLGTNTAYSWWEGRKDGIQLPTKKYYLKLKEILNLDNRFDELIEREEAEREVVGTKQKLSAYSDKGYSSDGANYENTEIKITTPATPQAKALDGSYAGFQPKPAVEVIIVAMKSLSEKTYVGQALRNRKGITWQDDCRVPYESGGDISTNPLLRKSSGAKINAGIDTGSSSYSLRDKVMEMNINSRGRFPANLIVSDDVLNDGKVSKSGKMEGLQGGFGNSEVYGDSGKTEAISHGDSGTFSRYFSLDAWWQGLVEKLPKDVQKVFPFLIVPKASKAEKNKGLDAFENSEVYTKGHGNQEEDDVTKRFRTITKCTHPTVKPIQLFTYLITLGSRQGDLILDPFIGSGTAGISARMLSRDFIGFEKNEEYYKIAVARLKPYLEQKKLGEWES